ncbi:minor capsid protein [Enterococcus mundtii]|uniref:putative minor capsid protein n=2 Tax=Enterococcus mundtii TaxID=53346 RepID=UPI000F7CF3F8|nr:putative minor capsid protein [Enterococcus mundtii]AZP93502.1 minor capsid protein [Enterococcus mundtii]MRI73620.1 minor capsid protein [Enterococcus mundtii]
MRMPPKRFFPHAMIYRKKNGMGPRSEPIFEDDLAIEHVRFDDTVKFEPRDIDGKVQTPNALISMAKKYTGPLPEFSVADQIEIFGEQYTITKIVPLLADSPEPFAYELEVV